MARTSRRRALMVAAALLLPLAAPARQPADCPMAGTVIYPSLTGAQLRDSLRVHFRPTVNQGYNHARDLLYTQIDNHGGRLRCIYSGFTIDLSPASTDPRTEAFDRGINAEHSWPQSKGAENEPMRSDMHHLYPSEINVNNARASWPFDEIPDNLTDSWYRLKSVQSTIPTTLIDEYSELDNQNPNAHYTGRFEPREDHQGNVARAMFYFYTVYRAECDAADPFFFDAQKQTLREWNAIDPPDSMEVARTCAIAPYQQGKYNPYVIDPTLVERAWFSDVSVTLASFEGAAVGRSVHLHWVTAAEADHLGFFVYREEAAGRWDRLASSLVTGGPAYDFVDEHPWRGQPNRYLIESLDRHGATERYGPVTVAVPEAPPAVAVTPNPGRGPVRFLVTAPAAGPLRVTIVDLTGRRIRALARTIIAPGDTELNWDGLDGSGAPARPGIYWYRVDGAGLRLAGRFVVVGR